MILAILYNNKKARHILLPAALKYFSASIIPQNIYFTIVRPAQRPYLAAIRNRRQAIWLN